MKFVAYDIQPMTPERRAELRQKLQAAIDGAQAQIKWGKAFAAFAESEIDSYATKRKSLGVRHLPALLKALPADVLEIGEITATPVSGWVEFKLKATKPGIKFPLRSDFVAYTSTNNGNPIARAAADALEFVKSLEKIVDSNADLLGRLDAELDRYEKAAALVIEAQGLLKQIALPWNIAAEIETALPLTGHMPSTFS